MKILKPSNLYFICILSLLVFTIFSCKKGGNSFAIKSEDAVIVNRGSIAADGCGWQIMTTDSTYYPENLAAQFQVNNLKVHITYHRLQTRFYCSQVANNPGLGLTIIHLDAITTSN